MNKKVKSLIEATGSAVCSVALVGVIAGTLTIFFSSCGHNIATQNKGVGINLSWNGDSYVPNLKLGYWDDTTAVVRGNTTVSTSTATGGGMFSGEGGTSQSMQVITGTQVNEGNIKDILTDPNLTTEAKVAFINALTKLEHNSADNASNKTVSTESMIIKDSENIESTKEQLNAADEAIDELVNKLESIEKKDNAPRAVPASDQ